jgi:lysyl-tRNA synthetase class 2
MRSIRKFFESQDFLEVLTPPVVENPGMETHIHPFAVKSVLKKQDTPHYLHTSPEFAMKKILTSEEFEKIFSMSYVFRDEPNSPIHRSQFIMLEWYRKSELYDQILNDAIQLIEFCLNDLKRKNIPVKMDKLKFDVMTMQEIFNKYLKIDILNYLEVSTIKNLIKEKFPDVPLPSTELAWDDYFFLLFLNKIEPEISKIPALVIKEFPAPLSALSTLKVEDKRVCERFEIYINGIELCNAFQELTDLPELQNRFDLQNKEKLKNYGYSLPEPKEFYQTMQNYPKSSGIALGVERLLLSLVDTDEIFFT